MGEQRFKSVIDEDTMSIMPYLVSDNAEECFYNLQGCVDLLNTQQSTIIKLNDEKDYWKNKAMTLLMQVRRLTSRMTDKEVKEFSKELEE